MKKKLVSILLILFVFSECRSPDPENAFSTGPPSVGTNPTSERNESYVSVVEPTVPTELTVLPVQKETIPQDATTTEPQQNNSSAECSPPETSPMQTAPSPTQPLTKPTAPPDTKPAETVPPETQPPETEPKETAPVDTEPPATAPTESKTTESSGCNHDWICIHHEEDGHWIAGIVCDCGWKVYGDSEEVISLWNDHSASYPAAEALFDHGGYGCVDEWIVDAPAYDEWVCRHCAEPRT